MMSHDELTVNTVVLHLKSGSGVNLDIDLVFLNLEWNRSEWCGAVWFEVE